MQTAMNPISTELLVSAHIKELELRQYADLLALHLKKSRFREPVVMCPPQDLVVCVVMFARTK